MNTQGNVGIGNSTPDIILTGATVPGMKLARSTNSSINLDQLAGQFSNDTFTINAVGDSGINFDTGVSTVMSDISPATYTSAASILTGT